MDIQKLLIEVYAINERYLQLARQTGSSFNVFDVLKVKTNEVRLHSAFIAELLDINGCHSQGDRYLKLFLEVLKIQDYNTKQSVIEVEKQTGKINDDKSEGGNIDIILNDKKQVIIIENKIYAPDQEAQLFRYYNYAKNNNFSPIHLFYLNLDGSEPSDRSKKELDLHQFRIISYESTILQWLDKCYSMSINLPSIRETILQYINIIKSLTNKITSNEMNNEIIEKILESKTNFDSAKLIQSAYNNAIESIKSQIKLDLNVKLSDSKFSIEGISDVNENLKIELHAGEDTGGFYFAFRLVNATNSDKYSVSSANYIVREQAEKVCKGLYAILSDNFKSIRNDFNTSSYSLVWYNPKLIGKGNKLENIDSELFIGLFDVTKRTAFIDEILNEALEIIHQFTSQTKIHNQGKSKN